MKQLVIPRYGPPEVLEVREAPEPRVEAGTVRIRVHAATCDIRPGRRPRGRALTRLVEDYRARAGI